MCIKCVHIVRVLNLNIITIRISTSWGCISEVQRKLNIFAVGISKCCRGLQKTAGGFKWEYMQDLERRDSNEKDNNN